MSCNCEFCMKCENCGHRADEHIAGEGHCFLCDCGQFKESLAPRTEFVSKAEQRRHDALMTERKK